MHSDLGQPVTLAREAGISHLDAGPLHLLTTAALAWLRATVPAVAADARRFRPNLLIDVPGDTQVERGWLGKMLSVGGEVRLQVSGATARLLPPHLATWLKAMPSPASTGSGVRRPQRLPVQPTPLRSIPDASGSISCFWAPIGPLWCVDRTHPTGYDVPEIDLGGDISWRGESGAERKGPAHKARLPGDGSP